MKIAFLLDPLDSIKTYKDTTYAIMEEAVGRGHELHVLQIEDLFFSADGVKVFAQSLELVAGATHWYRVSEKAVYQLANFDVVLMRKDPPFDLEYLYSTYLLEIAMEEGARVFNAPKALRDYNEKLAIAKFRPYTVPTLVTRHGWLIRDFLDQEKDIILKPLNAMGGQSIFRLGLRDPNLNVIIETMTEQGKRSVMAQRYIPEIKAGDKRIILIDGAPLPYALARIPKEGESRGNLAAGGKGVAMPLKPRDLEIAEAVGKIVRQDGLLLVGLDVIGDYLTEVNVTSPTGMREIMEQTGYDVAGHFLDALEKKITGVVR
jgi:glutathione synthase